MKKQIFIMMVGIQGSGKSFEACKLKLKYNAIIHSLDKKREIITGNEDNQDENMKVFFLTKNEIISDLKNGKNVIYDATNISRADRKDLIKLVNSVDKNIYKKCIYMNISLKKCLMNNENRKRKVPKEILIDTFNRISKPTIEEGWDSISEKYDL